MKLFLCWSGNRSKEFAEILMHWLPKVVGPKLQPTMSSKIEKGVGWLEALLTHVEGADAGLLCLTPENLTSSWIHFEAGMLGKAVRERYARLPDQAEGPQKHARPCATLLLVRPGASSRR